MAEQEEPVFADAEEALPAQVAGEEPVEVEDVFHDSEEELEDEGMEEEDVESGGRRLGGGHRVRRRLLRVRAELDSTRPDPPRVQLDSTRLATRAANSTRLELKGGEYTSLAPVPRT